MWYLIIYCISIYFLGAMGVVLGYHRCLTHKAFVLQKWLERILVTLGLPAGTPVQWVGNHRYHHQYTDAPQDPHSPVQRGFWFAHNGWYFNTDKVIWCVLYSLAGPMRMLIDAWIRPRSNQQYNHLAKDVQKDAYYQWLSRPLPYGLGMFLYLWMMIAFGYYLAEIKGIIAVWITLVMAYNAGDAIDSVAHIWGKKPYTQTHEARNVFWLSFFTLGDGWHADHHLFPKSAKLNLPSGKWDIGWKIVLIFKWLGWASNIHIPPKNKGDS
jgi:fatty-acid desaturase